MKNCFSKAPSPRTSAALASPPSAAHWAARSSARASRGSPPELRAWRDDLVTPMPILNGLPWDGLLIPKKVPDRLVLTYSHVDPPGVQLTCAAPAKLASAGVAFNDLWSFGFD